MVTRPRILVVDDQDALRRLYQLVLTYLGYDNEATGDSREALALLESGRFDLVICDLDMRHFDGAGLVRSLRAAGSRVPVLIVSAALPLGGILPGDIRDEVAVVLPKPTGAEELLAGIKRALNWKSSKPE